MHRGYIKIWRKIEDWEWYDDSLTVWFFVRLLFMANWEEKKWHGITIKRGQFISSIEHLRFIHGVGKRSIRLSTKQVRTLIGRLKTTNELASESTNLYTLFSIVNWEKYQGIDGNPKGNPSGNQKGKQGASGRATTKEGKNYKNEKNIYVLFEKFYEFYPRKKGKKPALEAFLKLNPNEVTFERIMKAIEVQKKADPQWSKDHGQFIPYPATWLNQARWQDEIIDPNIDAKKEILDGIKRGQELSAKSAALRDGKIQL